VSNAEQPIAVTDLLGDLDLKLPAGFELIAADPKLGPQILSSLARIEERLAEAIAQTDHLADVASRHLLSAGGQRGGGGGVADQGYGVCAGGGDCGSADVEGASLWQYCVVSVGWWVAGGW